MLRLTRIWLLLPVGLLVHACSTARVAPVEDRTTTPTAPVVTNRTPESAPPPIVTAPRSQPQQPVPAPPAVTALLDDAEQTEANGDPEAAAATLERALKIEPKNAVLWNRLAGVHMRRGETRQALSMAQKSNTLAAGNYELQLENWYLILAIHTQTGNAQGLAEARRKIDDLRRLGAGTGG